MLIQTNDGITGLDSVALTQSDLKPMIYDAGTEENTELKVHIPGFGGLLSGPAQNPLQPISMHEGIKGRAEVEANFGWSEPVAQFSIRAVNSNSTGVMPIGMPRTGKSDSQAMLFWIAILGVTLLVGGALAGNVQRIRNY